LDGDTGEVFERRLTPDYREILDWLRSLPGRVAVTYEAGPTGFGLARFLIAAGIMCLVAAPSKLQRLPGIGSRPMPAMRRIWPGCCT
jgi:transposase